MKFGIVVFPGSNCDQDCFHFVTQILEQEATFLWHKEASLPKLDCILLPGGFSYGDYLRCGAIARFSPVMREIAAFAKRGGLVIGICNGFQILTEAQLLPGALLRNHHLRFICREVDLRLKSRKTPFTHSLSPGQTLKLPIAHGDGNYFIDADGLKSLEDHDQIILQYCDESGKISWEANPNGSVQNIAGICNQTGNVFGLMPHPERRAESLLGGEDGKKIFASLL